MRLTIIAATGGVGRELLEQAVAAGHHLTTVVRDPGKLSRPVRTVAAHLMLRVVGQPQTIHQAIGIAS